MAVIGATGRIGGQIVEWFSRTGRYDVLGLSHQDLDVVDESAVKRRLLHQPLDVVINTAAFHSVDGCQRDPRTSFAVNAIGAMNVAAACREIDALCVYLSTDYVFDGRQESPHDEDARPNPINVYGVSKLAGEQLTMSTAPRRLIFRVERVFGPPGPGRPPSTYVDALYDKAAHGQTIRAVDSHTMSPTYSRDAVKLLDDLLQAGATGVIHATNGGSCTWLEFTQTLLSMLPFDVPVESVPAESFLSDTPRPTHTALRSKRIKQILGREMRHWSEALREYLVAMGYIEE
ncbi:MAG: dTDP-4-dehydrorhamnose reductase [Phycisphaerae bacterium]|nr:dTDP-4-dehydrorhamnose reductase [Phycisphaerae bacterium]